MKIESRVVAVSWIPSEAVKGAMKAPFELGIAHYDEPLPDVLGDLDDWRKRDMFRVANDLRAWIGVDDDGKITGYGYSAGGVIGSTTMGLGSASATFQAVAVPHPAARARGGRRLGAVPADRRRPHRRAGAPARRQAAVRAVPRTHRVVDAVADDPRRRSVGVRPRRRQPVPAPLGVRPRREAGAQVRAWSTSRTGTATPSATSARGAARTRRRSSPRSSRRWSGSCPG